MATIAAPALIVIPRTATVVPTILWPCGAALLAGTLAPALHDRWPEMLALALFGLLVAIFVRAPMAWSAAVSLLAFSGALWHAAPPPERPIIWTTEPVNAVRGIVADWPTTHGEVIHAPVDVTAARTDRGWEPARVILLATLPAYPPLQRGDAVVVGGIATVRRGWWRDGDGSLYGQWMRIERFAAETTPGDLRHRVVARFIAGINDNVRPPESGLTVGMLLGEKTVLDDQTREALNSTGTTQHRVIPQ